MDEDLHEPPINFSLADDHTQKYASCKFCQCFRRSKFICTKCIQTGNFMHSTSYLKESFLEKQIRLRNLKKALALLDEKADSYFAKKRHLEDLNSDIETKNKNIVNLERAIKEMKDSIKIDKNRNELLAKNNSQKQYYLPRYEDKVKKLEDYVLTKIDEVEQSKQKHNEKYQEFQKVVVQNITSLVKFIFPIKFIPDSRDLRYGTEGVLAEATKTVCVKGKWQMQESGCNAFYEIVAPYLPADGEYNFNSIYNEYTLTNKDAAPAQSESETTLIHNPAYRIYAALTYCAHLVQQLSFYLDVRLPFKLSIADFCKISTSEQSFLRKLNRLNANILFLCYTQKLKLTTLNPSHTLENLYKLLYTPNTDLGRRGYTDLSDCLPAHVNLEQKLATSYSSGDDTDNDDSDETTLTHEWEAVSPNAIAFEATNVRTMQPQSSFYTSFANYIFGRK